VRVSFILPGFPSAPVGGFAVVYTYANHLTRRGHQVNVIHPRAWMTHAGWSRRAVNHVRALARSAVGSVPRDGRPAWFPLDADVRSVIVPRLAPNTVPDGDAVFATAWETASIVHALPPPTGRKLYLIQHYETWSGPQELVDATWRLPMDKVVISKWLLEIAQGLGVAGETTYIPNGIDLERFRITDPPQRRDRFRVGLLHHRRKWKGTADGLRALESVRRTRPGLEAVLFGTAQRPRVPEWVIYAPAPAGERLVELYNSMAIFLHPSWTEGWPLPPAEAMACGCALVAAANRGVSEYATDGSTALMAPVRDIAGLAAAVDRLIDDDDLRVRIATAGHAHIRSFSWEAAVDRLEALLTAGSD